MEPGELLDEWLTGTINRRSQLDARGVYLTVGEIHAIHMKGRLDFGGSEFKPAGTHGLDVMERSPTDKYGWWRLEGGTYQVRFNEKLKDGCPAMLMVAADRLLECGCQLTACVVGTGVLQSTLAVPPCGVNIKQNARIALLHPSS
jgi:hypothetical protein